VMGNQILADEIPTLRRTGYLEGGIWTKPLVSHQYPQVMNGGQIDEARLLTLPATDQVKLGEVLFQYHCNDCHAAIKGYSPVAQLIRNWTPEMIRTVVEHPEKAQFFMPPWAGTPEEAEMLTKYLISIAPPHPGGMYYGTEK
ncbi:MAG: cytochrome c, partial [Acidobacteria bacterium]|nr:cytochrome c [Acidobacteriota bacterium]